MKSIAATLLLLSLTGACAASPQNASAPLSTGAFAKPGPRYDVTGAAFGTKGDNLSDDTAAIQAAFDACWNHGATPHGGVVEFPGNHTYVVSSTINAYDGCWIEGMVGNSAGGYSPPRLAWNGAAKPAKLIAITQFTTAANAPPYIFAPSSPAVYHQPFVVTFTAANELHAGDWVEIAGLSTAAGIGLNRGVLQIASATGTSFTAVVPFPVAVGAFTDSGTAKLVSVFIAFGANAHFEQTVTDIGLADLHPTQSNSFDVGFYFGARVDTGTHITNTWVGEANEYSYYFSAGGINVDFDKGWRSDGARVAGIYWRPVGSDSFGLANGTIDNYRDSGTSGAAVMLDNSACLPGTSVHFSSRNFKIEDNTSLAAGLGTFMLYDCPSDYNLTQFYMDFVNTWVMGYRFKAGFNFSSFVVSPPNDAAVTISALNSQFGTGEGANTTQPFVGIPNLARANLLGNSGLAPLLVYAPSLRSSGISPSASSAPIQLIGDVNIGQLWQYGLHASDFLYADTAFAALPNGTTLYAGQILAPPSYWNGAGGKRYAIDVVSKTGTTGTPNGGRSRCSGEAHTALLTCTSAADLSTGQIITLGADQDKRIKYVDATHPDAVLVNLADNLAASHRGETLTFFAPVLASEMQLPTKSPSAPAALAWSQGDMEQNSGAAANGVAAWINTAAGSPGSWAGIPLGDSSGKIAAAQLNSARTAQAFCAGTASSSSTLLLFGAGSARSTCTQTPGPQAMQQILMTGNGRLSNLAVRCGHLGSRPASGRFTVWDLPSGAAMTDAASGTNTGITVTVGNSPANADKTLIDTQHSFAYAAGDMIRIQFTTEADETLADCTAAVNY